MTAIAPDADAIDRIAALVRTGKCILFLGAGVHAPPPEGSPFHYPRADRPPLGGELSQLLAAACGLADRFPNENPANLQRVALFYEIARSRNQLAEEIRNAVHVSKAPSPMVRALAELPFPLVITTNYDQLFESALRLNGKQPRVSIYTPHEERTTDYYEAPTPESPVIFKLHGDISQAHTLVVTDEDYIQFVLRMNTKEGVYDPIPLSLKYHLSRQTTLFIGYSLLDYNLRLLFKTLRWKLDKANVPDMYSVDRTPDPLIVDVWHNQRRYITFIAQDIWSFVPTLYESVTRARFIP